MKKYTLLSAVATIVVCGCGARAQPRSRLIAPGGIRAAIKQMIPPFRADDRPHGEGDLRLRRRHKGPHHQGRAVRCADRTITTRAGGRLRSCHGRERDAARGRGVGVAVRTGAPKPDISSAEAVKRMLLGAGPICLSQRATGAAAGVASTRRCTSSASPTR